MSLVLKLLDQQKLQGFQAWFLCISPCLAQALILALDLWTPSPHSFGYCLEEFHKFSLNVYFPEVGHGLCVNFVNIADSR